MFPCPDVHAKTVIYSLVSLFAIIIIYIGPRLRASIGSELPHFLTGKGEGNIDGSEIEKYSCNIPRVLLDAQVQGVLRLMVVVHYHVHKMN